MSHLRVPSSPLFDAAGKRHRLYLGARIFDSRLDPVKQFHFPQGPVVVRTILAHIGPSASKFTQQSTLSREDGSACAGSGGDAIVGRLILLSFG